MVFVQARIIYSFCIFHVVSGIAKKVRKSVDQEKKKQRRRAKKKKGLEGSARRGWEKNGVAPNVIAYEMSLQRYLKLFFVVVELHESFKI